MKFSVYVCDSNKDVKILMKEDCNPNALFMTIRVFNKYVKLWPKRRYKKENTEFLELDIDGQMIKYSVVRVKVDNKYFH